MIIMMIICIAIGVFLLYLASLLLGLLGFKSKEKIDVKKGTDKYNDLRTKTYKLPENYNKVRLEESTTSLIYGNYYIWRVLDEIYLLHEEDDECKELLGRISGNGLRYIQYKFEISNITHFEHFEYKNDVFIKNEPTDTKLSFDKNDYSILKRLFKETQT